MSDPSHIMVVYDTEQVDEGLWVEVMESDGAVRKAQYVYGDDGHWYHSDARKSTGRRETRAWRMYRAEHPPTTPPSP